MQTKYLPIEIVIMGKTIEVMKLDQIIEDGVFCAKNIAGTDALQMKNVLGFSMTSL